MPTVRPATPDDLGAMTAIWNEVVRDGVAFPQTDELDTCEGRRFFDAQTHCGVAVEEDEVAGLYILHPNNIGRCGHIANASYAVRSSARNRGVGRLLVLDSVAKAKELGFQIMQFNAVVATNTRACHPYESLRACLKITHRLQLLAARHDDGRPRHCRMAVERKAAERISATLERLGFDPMQKALYLTIETEAVGSNVT